MNAIHPLVSALAALPLAAQAVTWQAITQAGMKVAVTSAGTQTLPPLTNISTGVNLALNSSNSYANARARFQATTTPDSLTFDFLSGGSGGFALAYYESGYSGPNDVLLTLATPTKVGVIMRIEYCGSRSDYGAASLVLKIGANGSVGSITCAPQPNTFECLLGPKIASFKAFLDTTPLPITVQMDAGGGGGMGHIENGTVYAKLIVTADQEWPCRPAWYGSSCGANLGFTTTLAYPGSSLVTLADNGLPTNFWLLVGDQKAQTPIGPCLIYNNLLALLPMVPTTPSSAAVRVVPPPIPGLRFYLQGATWDGASLHFTAGAEVFCF